MKKTPGRFEHLLHLNVELVITICNMLLQHSFLDFSNLFQVWFPYHIDSEILTLIRSLDWSFMHQFDAEWGGVGKTRFDSFLAQCNRNNVPAALCYNACKEFVSGNDQLNALKILRAISPTDSLAAFAFNIFSPLFNFATVQDCAQAIYLQMSTNVQSRDNMLANCRVLKGRIAQHRVGWVALPSLLPHAPTCPLYRNRDGNHVNPFGWPVSFDVIFSLQCGACVLQVIYLELLN